MRRLVPALVCLLVGVAACDNPVRKATRLVQEGKLEEAKALLNTSCFDKSVLAACLAAGNSELEQERYEEATRFAEQAQRIDPDDATSLLILGNVARADKDLTRAQAYFERARDADPQNAMAHNNLGAVYLDAGRIDDAERELRAAIELNDDLFLAWLNLGRVQAARGKAAEARDTWEYAARLDPSSADVHVLLAEVASAQGDSTGAIRHLQDVVDLEPMRTDIRIRLGKALLADGRAEEAILAVREAVEQDPTPEARRLLARAYLAAGNAPFAVGQLRAALRDAPEETSLASDLALALLLAGEHDAARIQATAVLRAHPDAADCEYVLGALADQGGKLEKARAHYARVVKQDPGHVLARMRLIELALDRHAPAEASEHLKAVEDARSLTPRLYFLEARTRAQQGRSAEALGALQQAMLRKAVSPDEAEAAPELRALRDDPDTRDAFDRLVGKDS